MSCKHETLAMENAKIILDNYEEFVDVEYDRRCEDCGKVIGKEVVRYLK